MHTTAPDEERILLSVWPGLGDIMFATLAIRMLRRALPGAFIAAASFAGGPGLPLLETNPYLDEVYFSQRGTYSPAGLRESLRWMRERRFDTAVELSHPVQWLFRLAGIERRYRFARRGLWWLYPYRDKSERDLHAAEQFTRAVEQACGPLERDGLGYDLVLTDEDEARAAELLTGGWEDGFVAIHPGARCNENKRWDAAKFVALGRRLMAQHNRALVVLGGPDDAALAARIQQEIGEGVLALAGRATLRETAAVVRRADLYVGNDSGPMHIAASTGTPVVAVFASSNPANFGPVGCASLVVAPEDACAPCLHFPGYNWLPWGLRLRYYRRCKAMEHLGLDPVLHACASLLD